MRMVKSRYPAWPILVGVLCLPVVIAGCRPVGWLPDSSGFVYTDDKDCRRLVRYDVNTGKRHVLVAKLPAHAQWPAVSPDGKRIAVARLIKDPKEKKPDAMQVILYDLEGKEVRRSDEFTWAPCGKTKDHSHTGVFWITKSDRLIVQDFEEPGRVGIYDSERERLIVLEGSPPAFGGTPCRPDGKGFLVVRPDGPTVKLALVDWDGKEKPIRMRPEAIDSEDKVGMLTFPSIGTSAWEDNVAVVSYGTGCVRIDTNKLVGTFESVPKKEAFADGKEVLQRFAFPKGGVNLRVLLAQKGEGSPNEKDMRLHLELLDAKKEKPRLLKEVKNGRFFLSPSPDGKWLAVRAGGDKVGPDEVLLVSSGGEVREINSEMKAKK